MAQRNVPRSRTALGRLSVSKHRASPGMPRRFGPVIPSRRVPGDLRAVTHLERPFLHATAIAFDPV